MTNEIDNAFDRLGGDPIKVPDAKQVREDIKAFLNQDSEKDWVKNAIKHDAALKTKKTPESQRAELMTYQGLHALALHHEAHGIHNAGQTLVKEGEEQGDQKKIEQGEQKKTEARVISQGARHVTGGIEIHPGAVIGKNCFIDHGASLVIGGTAVIGDDVSFYHGITLGATDGSNERNGERRHPKLGNKVDLANGVQVLGSSTIGNNVRIGAGAKIIGNDITISDGATIGAGVEITAKSGSKIVIGPNVTLETGAKVVATSKGQYITIGQGANIAAGTIVRKNVEPFANVVGETPNLPGILPENQVNMPIFTFQAGHERPLTQVGNVNWLDTLVSSLKGMIGMQPSA